MIEREPWTEGEAVAVHERNPDGGSAAASLEGEARFQAIYEQAAVGIEQVGLDGRLLLVNPALCRMLDYSREELQDRTFEAITHPDDRPRESGLLYALLDGRTSTYRLEKRYLRRDGTPLWVDLTTSLVRDEQGQPAYRISVVVDISERHRAVAELTESEDQFRAFFELAAVGAAQVETGTGRLLRVNDQYCEITGYTRDELLTRTVRDLTHPDDRDQDWALFSRMLQGEVPEYNAEKRYVRKDGRTIWVHATARPIRDADGRTRRTAGILQDITVRRQAEAALRESEERFRGIFEQAAVGIALLDLDGRWLMVNQRLCEIVGYTEAEMQALTFQAITHPEDLETDLALVRQLLAGTRSTYTMEKRYLQKDGSTVWILLSVSLLRQPTGEPHRFVSVMKDISARKQAEAEVRQLNESLEQRVSERTAELKEVNDELEAFSYTVSHDLRAPLRAMHGFAAALQEDFGDRLPDRGQEYTRRIVDAAERMDEMIRDLLAYSRLSRSQLDLEPVDLASVAATVLTAVERELREREGRITIHEPLGTVIGHRLTLVQVLTNLVTNALKFVPLGAAPAVDLCAEPRAGWVRLWVQDRGIGIAPEHRERIFQVFERLHGAETYPGTGIGLAIARKGIERMGGRLGLEAAPGQGSRFWIELPAAPKKG